MQVRTFLIAATFLTVISTGAISQGGGAGGGAGGGGGAPGGAGATTSGTAGSNSSISTPPPGTLAAPGAASGAGIPGGPGPANAVVAPNIPGMPQQGPTVGRDSGGNLGAFTPPVGGSSGSSGPATQTGSRITVRGGQSDFDPTTFNPGAVADSGLDAARQDISAMTPKEQRDLVALLETCTAGGHPIERSGKCGAANQRYKASYAKDRNIDRTLKELDRVVRYQSMFKKSPYRITEYEDSINDRLRSSAKESLAASTPEVSRNVSLSN